MKTATTTQAARIAELNDFARQAMGVACRAVMTDGIAALDGTTQSRIRERVETFDDFTPDNDPHGERDFGAIEVDGVRVYWKIDYYDRSLRYHAEDPGDPSKSIRVLTIMLASEY